MIASLCYCVSPHAEFVCGMLLCAANPMRSPMRSPTRTPTRPPARTLTQPARAWTLCVLRVGVIIYNIYRFISRTSEPLLLSPAPQDKTVLAFRITQHDISHWCDPEKLGICVEQPSR